MKLISEFKEWRKERAARIDIAKKNEAYLVNAFADKEYLEKIIKQIQRCPDVSATLFTLDGMRLELSNRSHTGDKKRTIDWDKD